MSMVMVSGCVSLVGTLDNYLMEKQHQCIS